MDQVAKGPMSQTTTSAAFAIADSPDQTGSPIYRATIRHGLPTLVTAWTVISIALSVLVTAALTSLIWGDVRWRDLVFSAAVTTIVTIPVAYKIGKMVLELNRSRTALRELAQRDALTGLANRGYFFQHAEHMISGDAMVWPMSALMIDVDHFKSINDEGGHITGDKVLREVACILQGKLRSKDFLARYGGEEFAAILPGADRTVAVATAERMRVAVAESPELFKLARHSVTISVGVAQTNDRVAIDPVLLAADRALYTAKANGRNRCTFIDVADSLSVTQRLRAIGACANKAGAVRIG